MATIPVALTASLLSIGTLAASHLGSPAPQAASRSVEGNEGIELRAAMGMEAAFLDQLIAALPKNAGLPVGLTVHTRSGDLAAGAEVRIDWEGGREHASCTATGRLEFEMLPWALATATASVPEGFVLAVDTFSTTALRVSADGKGFENGPLRITQSAGNEIAPTLELRLDTLVVRAPEGSEDVAQQALGALARIDGFVAAYGGFAPMRLNYGIDLRASLDAAGKSSDLLLPFELEAWEEADALDLWIVSHEMAELRATEWIPLSDDPRLRATTDGIAELISFEYAARYAPDQVRLRLRGFQKAIEECKAAGQTTLDLEDFLSPVSSGVTEAGANADGEAGGNSGAKTGGRIGERSDGVLLYAVSLVRWHAAERSTPGTTRRILEAFSKGELRTNEDCERRLTEAGNVPSRTMSLTELEQGLERLLEELPA